jgi:hypothetical protein
VLTETRDEQWRGNLERPRFSSRFVIDGPGTATGNLNVLYGRLYYDYLETGTRTEVGGSDRARRVTVDEHGHNYEVGGDYDFELGPGRLKLIGVGRGSRYPSETVVVTHFADDTAEGERFTTAGGERSQLAQVGAGGTTRTFVRPKGELSAAWKASPRTDVNIKLARRVGQLNFFDFAASVNLQDDNETAGNPDLVPEQSWDLDVETVRNLGPLGTTTLRLYGRLIDDIIDYVPIGTDGEAPGNLDRAVVYGFESRSTFNLERAGWNGARLDFEAQLQRSEVEDPLTGEKRPISNSLQEWASFALRHDIPGTEWAWGTGASYQLNAKSYRLTEVGRLWEGPIWGDLYLEHKNVYGLTVRAGVYNALAADSMWDRTVHAGRRTDPVDFIEERDRQIGPIFSFQIRGKF